MTNFWKGIVVGLGAVAPGLSGSVLLVIFGLYRKTITAISTIFQDFKNNLKFLIPLGLGMVLGVLLFSNLVKFLLLHFPMQTRFSFLGLVLGSLPTVFQEVRREGYHPKYLLLTGAALAAGIYVFYFSSLHFDPITDPSLLQCILLGAVVAASYIVPGIDSATILSALGMYVLWNDSLADVNLSVLAPAAIGLAAGVLLVSFTVSKLMKVCYTGTFSVIFGLFLSIVPSVLRDEARGFIYVPAPDVRTAVSVALLVLCLGASLLFGNWQWLLKKRRK